MEELETVSNLLNEAVVAYEGGCANGFFIEKNVSC